MSNFFYVMYDISGDYIKNNYRCPNLLSKKQNDSITSETITQDNFFDFQKNKTTIQKSQLYTLIHFSFLLERFLGSF